MHAAFASSFKTVTPMHAGFPSSLGLDAINVAFLKREEKEVQQAGKGCQTNPLLITPRFENSLEFLSDWLAENRSFVTDSLHQYGAVFLRGFDIDGAVDLEKAIKFQCVYLKYYNSWKPLSESKENVCSYKEISKLEKYNTH